MQFSGEQWKEGLSLWASLFHPTPLPTSEFLNKTPAKVNGQRVTIWMSTWILISSFSWWQNADLDFGFWVTPPTTTLKTAKPALEANCYVVVGSWVRSRESMLEASQERSPFSLRIETQKAGLFPLLQRTGGWVSDMPVWTQPLDFWQHEIIHFLTI